MNNIKVLSKESPEVQFLCKNDKRLKKVFDLVGNITYVPHEDGYYFLLHEIIEQMLSVKAASVIFDRLVTLCKGDIIPERITALSDDQIKSIGTSKRKVETIRNLTDAIINKDIILSDFETMTDCEVISKLTSIKGIGSWTAKMYLIFVLDRPDVLPVEDVAFLQGFCWAYQTIDRDSKEVQKQCKKWKPYSSIAARYMYQALDKGLTKEPFDYSEKRCGAYLKELCQYLHLRNIEYTNKTIEKRISERQRGKRYDISEHIRGLIYALLSNQTKWYRIEASTSVIDDIFFRYNPIKILETDPIVFCNKLFHIKCGNVSTKAQMYALADNIRIFYQIERDYGSMDDFLLSEQPDSIVQKLSDKQSKYKIKMMGQSLAWEYLRQVGIDGIKPDTHLRRFYGRSRMGDSSHTPATIKEVIDQVRYISEKTGMPQFEIDSIIWHFCAEGYGEICTANPKCDICPIRSWCNT